MLLKKNHHRIGGGNVQRTVKGNLQGTLKGVPAEHQAETVTVIPYMVRSMAQSLQEALGLTGTGKCDLVQAGLFVGSQELVVAQCLDIVGLLRHNPGHFGLDHHGAVGFQNTHTLFAVHNIELAQILAAADGINEAGIAQMLHVQPGPGFSKFALHGGQWLEVTGVEVSVGVDDNTCAGGVLQQLDGNVIGPKILGDSTGLPALWVMFAILVGGGIFGIIGMFVGVPAFAVIYKFTKEYLENKLNEKNLPEKTESYKVIKGSKNLDDIEKGEI